MLRKWLTLLFAVAIMGMVMPRVSSAQSYVMAVGGHILQVQRMDCGFETIDQDDQVWVCRDNVYVEYQAPPGYVRHGWVIAWSRQADLRPCVGQFLNCIVDTRSYAVCDVDHWCSPPYAPSFGPYLPMTFWVDRFHHRHYRGRPFVRPRDRGWDRDHGQRHEDRRYDNPRPDDRRPPGIYDRREPRYLPHEIRPDQRPQQLPPPGERYKSEMRSSKELPPDDERHHHY